MLRMPLFVLFALLLYGCSEPVKYEIVIENVGLFNGSQDLGIVNVAVNADTIASISAEPLLGNSTIDGTDKYLIPGLVNAHTHISSIEDLKEGYDLGILTLLNMHTGLEERELAWKTTFSDSVGFSELYGSGHAATVPGGHPNQFSTEMETINDSISIEEWVDNRISKNVDYIKIVRDHHEWMGSPPLPTLSYEQIGQIIEYSHSKGFKVVVHGNTVADMVKISEFKPNGFVHMPIFKEEYPTSDEDYKSIAQSGAFMIPTSGIILKPMEGAPPFIIDWLENNLLDSHQSADVLKKFHEAGVLIVAGTDAQEGQMNFAEDYYLELEHYQMAGLSNIEILKSTTGNAAKAFDLPIGEIKVGAKATMVLLGGNPIENIENLKEIEIIWKNGKSEL